VDLRALTVQRRMRGKEGRELGFRWPELEELAVVVIFSISFQLRCLNFILIS
jgi:hypothetical protein